MLGFVQANPGAFILFDFAVLVQGTIFYGANGG